MRCNSRQHELSIIGSILISPSCLADIANVRPDHFGDAQIGAIYAHAVALYGNGKPVNEESILLSCGEAPSVLATLVEAGGATATARNVGIHAAALIDSARRRRCLEVMHEALRKLEESADSADVIDGVASDLAAIAHDAPTDAPITLRDAVTSAHRSLSAGRADHLIRTGIDALDQYAGGIPRGLPTVIAARPSVGKSALAMNIIANVGASGQRVLIETLEDTSTFFAMRMISRYGAINYTRMVHGALSIDEHRSLVACIDRMPLDNVLISDRPYSSVAQIRATALQARRNGGLDLLVVDHIGELTDDESEYKSVSKNQRALRDLAKELDVALIVVQQLSRPPKGGEDRPPKMEDLRGSGRSEEIARNVWLLHRENRMDGNCDLQVRIEKASHGRTGIVVLPASMATMSIGHMQTTTPARHWQDNDY